MWPSIDRKKLENYVKGNNSYNLFSEGDKIELHFSPEFPEAMAHLPDGEPVEHIMYGFDRDGRIYFTSFKTKSNFGETVTELEGEDDPVMEWLKYI
jgi:hypothetical protein